MNKMKKSFSRKERIERKALAKFAPFAAKQERNEMKQMMVVAAVLLAATFAFAQDAEIVKVKGRGVGADKTEALKDAYRDAVERAVGLYVDAGFGCFGCKSECARRCGDGSKDARRCSCVGHERTERL